MKRTRLISILVLLALLVCVTAAMAGSGGGYDLSWSAISSGGQTFSTGGSYSLGGTTGQRGAGTMSGGVFILNGGFWSGDLVNHSYLPLLTRSN
jgi:hypothetical protein